MATSHFGQNKEPTWSSYQNFHWKSLAQSSGWYGQNKVACRTAIQGAEELLTKRDVLLQRCRCWRITCLVGERFEPNFFCPPLLAERHLTIGSKNIFPSKRLGVIFEDPQKNTPAAKFLGIQSPKLRMVSWNLNTMRFVSVMNDSFNKFHPSSWVQGPITSLRHNWNCMWPSQTGKGGEVCQGYVILALKQKRVL